MPRFLLVAGVDFGTSFTKVVLRDNNTPGSNAVVVGFPSHANRLLPSVIGIDGDRILPPAALSECAKLPYLKMLAAHVASGDALAETPIRIPAAFGAVCDSRSDYEVVRGLLAFYFAHVMAATEDFIRTRSPWRDFDFSPENHSDHLTYQLAVPSGLLADNGATERVFREAFIAGYELRRTVDPVMSKSVPHEWWMAQVAEKLDGDQANLESRFKWQCLLYPETAAAVQAYLRSPNAMDGLFITMDVGAGTVDMNAFRRRRAIRDCDYYSAIVCPLGVQNLNDPHGAVTRKGEQELMESLRERLQALYLLALIHQPNLGHRLGQRTWDGATLFIFGGGSHHQGYRTNFASGLTGIHEPEVHNLPAAPDLTLPTGIEFGRFAVAYGLSFFRWNLDRVRLPHELTPFRELYPQPDNRSPRQYGINWDD